MCEPCGRFWRMIETSDPATRRFEQPPCPNCYRASSATGNHTTDCSGDHAVMANQVRPWLAESEVSAALRVRQSDWEPASQSHQGQRLMPQQKSGCTGAIYPCKPSRAESLARLGA